jgi:hypothetical protein
MKAHFHALSFFRNQARLQLWRVFLLYFIDKALAVFT